MSHWHNGKISNDIQCSLAHLRDALVNIYPQWADHIRVDAGDGLPLYDYLGKKHGKKFNLVIPGQGNPSGKAPGVRWNDIGYKQLPDGSWESEIDPSGLAVSDLENRVKAEVAAGMVRSMGSLEGNEIVNEETLRDGTKVIDIAMDVGDEYLLQ